MLRADVLGEAALELCSASVPVVSQPGAQRVGDRLDLLLPDGRRLEREEPGPQAVLDIRDLELYESGSPIGCLERSGCRTPGREDEAGAVGAPAERAEHPARPPVGSHLEHPVDATRIVEPVHRDQAALRSDEKADAGAAPPVRLGRLDPLPERGGERERVEVDVDGRGAELGVVAAADPRGQLDDPRAVRSVDDLRVRRSVFHAQGFRRAAGSLRRVGRVGARPDVRERHTERRLLGREPVGNGQRVEPPVDRERVDGDLPSGDQLLDQAELVAGHLERGLDGLLEPARVLEQGQAALALAVRSLDDAGEADLARGRCRLVERGADRKPRLRHALLGEAVALAELGHAARGGFRVDRMRDADVLGDPGGDRDRPVASRRDDAVDLLRPSEPVEALLVLGRHDRPPVRVLEARSGRIAVAGDHEHAALSRCPQEPELRRPRP